MAVDPATGLLYVADTGGGRVLWLDTASGEEGGNLRGEMDPLDVYARWEGGEWGVLIDGLDRPGGLALTGARLYVGEFGTGVIHEYDLEGDEIRTLDTGLGEGSLYGVEIGPDGKLWIAEIGTPAVKRIEPQVRSMDSPPVARIALDAPSPHASGRWQGARRVVTEFLRSK